MLRGAKWCRVVPGYIRPSLFPAGEVVSIGQLASLAQRPVASAGGSKPLTFQIQGNKLTLTGAQVRQLAVGQPRPLQSR